MSTIGRKAAGIGLGALFAIGLGGAGLAYAQTADETPTTTTAPSASTPDTTQDQAPAQGHDPECEEKAGRSGFGGAV